MDLAALYRAEYGRCVATLTRLQGDIGIDEEGVQDAVGVAVEKVEKPPPHPRPRIVTNPPNPANPYPLLFRVSSGGLCRSVRRGGGASWAAAGVGAGRVELVPFSALVAVQSRD